jgi:nucleotide-binding universal stress UspA family protein
VGWAKSDESGNLGNVEMQKTGKPYREIIQFAEEAQIDLVTMGVRGRGALDLAVFGSTTYRVMQLGPAPFSLSRIGVI